MSAQKQIDTDPECPCIRQCCLDDQDVCMGCFRHLEEIKNWTLLDSAEKKAILKRAEHRKTENNERINLLFTKR